jgi:hypothetical protein
VEVSLGSPVKDAPIPEVGPQESLDEAVRSSWFVGQWIGVRKGDPVIPDPVAGLSQPGVARADLAHRGGIVCHCIPLRVGRLTIAVERLGGLGVPGSGGGEVGAGGRRGVVCFGSDGGEVEVDVPRGLKTEDGPRPEFAEGYGAVELASDDYADRTRANVRDADATLWFGDPDSPGGRTTLRTCGSSDQPTFLVIDGLTRPSAVAAWIVAEEVRVLNCAGNRESTAPGIGGRVEAFMVAIFRRLAEG